MSLAASGGLGPLREMAPVSGTKRPSIVLNIVVRNRVSVLQVDPNCDRGACRDAEDHAIGPADESVGVVDSSAPSISVIIVDDRCRAGIPTPANFDAHPRIRDEILHVAALPAVFGY